MLLHEDTTFKIIGCAQRVHAALGLPEAVYKRALCHEMKKLQLPFQTEAEFEVVYDNQLCGKFRVDILVDEKVIVELKSVESLCAQHVAQTLTYLRVSPIRVALLINFGEESLVFRRLMGKEKKTELSP